MPNQNDLPTPVTTDQYFMAKAAGMDVETPTPITPEQKYLKKIAEGGGVDPGEGYTKAQVDALLDDKVDKVSGKGLSTEDYTTAEKEKLSGIATGAEVNVQSDWSQSDNTADDFVKNKPTLGAAAAKGVDSSPTASSTNLVESGGVASALAGKQATLETSQQEAVDSGITAAKVSTYDGYATSKLSTADVFGRGTQIPKDTDLDDFKTIGRYYSGDSTRTNSLANKPFSNTGFDLEVRQSYQSQSSTDGIYQIAYTISGGVFTVKVRTYRYSGSPAAWAWSGWQTLAFTAAT